MSKKNANILQVRTCPFCGGNMAIRHGCNTGNIAIGCDNPKCINSVMYKIPRPDLHENQAAELWNARFDNDKYPVKKNCFGNSSSIENRFD